MNHPCGNHKSQELTLGKHQVYRNKKAQECDHCYRRTIKLLLGSLRLRIHESGPYEEEKFFIHQCNACLLNAFASTSCHTHHGAFLIKNIECAWVTALWGENGRFLSKGWAMTSSLYIFLKFRGLSQDRRYTSFLVLDAHITITSIARNSFFCRANQ